MADESGDRAVNRTKDLNTMRLLYFKAAQGIGDVEMSRLTGIPRASVHRYRKSLGAVEVSEGRYTLLPTQADIDLAFAVLRRVPGAASTR